MNLPSTSALAADSRGLSALRGKASTDPKTAIKETAKQFEALFMQELMKSMRQATMASETMENSGTKLGTELLDTQYASQMTGLKGGLGEAIARQLEKQMGLANGAAGTGGAAGSGAINLNGATGKTAAKPQAALAPAGAAGSAASGRADRNERVAGTSQRQTDFVSTHSDAAKAAEAQTGIPAEFMVAQAAHESGWGKREILNADGSTSHNLFGIKAGGSWKGPVAEVTTTEYVDGVARKVTAKFRAYSSYAESFADYANMMKSSPRYAKTVAQADTAEGFAKGLQKAGYATDPAYADKLTRMINTTLRVQRSLA